MYLSGVIALHSTFPLVFYVVFRAVYTILCGCDPHENHSEVCVKTEDYLWLKVGFSCSGQICLVQCMQAYLHSVG